MVERREEETPISPKANSPLPEIFSTKKIFFLNSSWSGSRHSEIPHIESGYCPRDEVRRRLFHQNSRSCDCDCVSDGCCGCLRRNKQVFFKVFVLALSIAFVLLLFGSLSYNLTRNKDADQVVDSEKTEFRSHYHEYNVNEEEQPSGLPVKDLESGLNLPVPIHNTDDYEGGREDIEPISLVLLNRPKTNTQPTVIDDIREPGRRRRSISVSSEGVVGKKTKNYGKKRSMPLLENLNGMKEGMETFWENYFKKARTVFEPFSLSTPVYSTPIQSDDYIVDDTVIEDELKNKFLSPATGQKITFRDDNTITDGAWITEEDTDILKAKSPVGTTTTEIGTEQSTEGEMKSTNEANNIDDITSAHTTVGEVTEKAALGILRPNQQDDTSATPSPSNNIKGISLSEAKLLKKDKRKKMFFNSRVVGGSSDVRLPTGPDSSKPIVNAFETLKTNQQLSFTPSAASQFILPYQMCLFPGPRPLPHVAQPRTFLGPVVHSLLEGSQPSKSYQPAQQNFLSLNINNFPNAFPPRSFSSSAFGFPVQNHFSQYPYTGPVPNRQPIFCTYLQPPLFQFPTVPGTADFNHAKCVDCQDDSEKATFSAKGIFPSGREALCSSDQVSCSDGSGCISLAHWCDNRVQCKDASDEAFCSCRERIASDRLCDGYVDCPHGEDEIGCFDCPKTSFTCESPTTLGPCMPLSMRCDGVKDCATGEDETDCSALFFNIQQNESYHVSQMSGFLHHNWKGDWFPVCVELGDATKETWAKEACAAELGFFPAKIKVNFAAFPENYKGPFIVRHEVGRVILQEHCKGHLSTFVTCPDVKCGTRVENYSQEFVSRYLEDRKIEDTRLKREETGRVVGGRKSEPRAWPWAVAVYRDGAFHCGGVILDKTWVLTAAHCMNQYWNHFYEVRGGMLRRFSFSPVEQVRSVADVIVHENYDDTIMSNDLALLRLQKPFHFNRWVRPGCLPSLGDRISKYLWGPAPGTQCIAVGWGALKERGIDPDQLREVEIPILTQCKHKEDLVGEEICAGKIEGGKDTCQGDSGGPLLCRDSSIPPAWYVAGIVSHGEGCARPGEPGAYTRISLFVDWITTNTNDLQLPFVKPLKTCAGFRCRSGSRLCIPNKWVCNGFTDCLEAEDERNCTTVLSFQQRFSTSEYKETPPIRMAEEAVGEKKVLQTTEQSRRDVKVERITTVESPSTIEQSRRDLKIERIATVVSPTTTEQSRRDVKIERIATVESPTTTEQSRRDLKIERIATVVSPTTTEQSRRDVKIERIATVESPTTTEQSRRDVKIERIATVESPTTAETTNKAKTIGLSEIPRKTFTIAGIKLKEAESTAETTPFVKLFPEEVKATETSEKVVFKEEEVPTENFQTAELTEITEIKNEEVWVSSITPVTAEETGVMTGIEVTEAEATEGAREVTETFAGHVTSTLDVLNETTTPLEITEATGKIISEEKIITVETITPEEIYEKISEFNTVETANDTPTAAVVAVTEAEGEITTETEDFTGITTDIVTSAPFEEPTTETELMELTTETFTTVNGIDISANIVTEDLRESETTTIVTERDPLITSEESEISTLSFLVEEHSTVDPSEAKILLTTAESSEEVTTDYNDDEYKVHEENKYDDDDDNEGKKKIEKVDEEDEKDKKSSKEETETEEDSSESTEETTTEEENLAKITEIYFESTTTKEEQRTSTEAFLTSIDIDPRLMAETTSESVQNTEMSTTLRSIQTKGITYQNSVTSSQVVTSQKTETTDVIQRSSENATSYFRCHHIVQSILQTYRCDGLQDCEDGSDEENCTCAEALISSNPKLVCDRRIDCPDRSDEVNCDACPKGRYLCPLSRECIPLGERCNGEYNCKFGEDESKCLGLSPTGEEEQFVQTKGFFMTNRKGIWTVECQEESPLTPKLAMEACSAVGTIGYEKYENRSAGLGCTGLYVTCSRNLISSLGRYQSADGSYRWPWHVFIFADGVHRCSAALLEPQWLLTSSDCLRNISLKNNYLVAKLGSRKQSSRLKEPETKLIQIDGLRSIPDSDIALLHLSREANETEFVRSIGIPQGFDSDFGNDLCVAVGDRTVFLKLSRRCPDSLRCYKKMISSMGNCRSKPWSGVIACQSRLGWYPASVYFERSGHCGLENVKLTSVQEKSQTIRRVLAEDLELFPEPVCSGFRCSQGLCIPLSKKCNGWPDCSSHEDERADLCSGKRKRDCKKMELRCRNGRCISKVLFGDGVDHCGDGSDEPANVTCAEYLNLTAPERLCDGKRNCYDKSDEQYQFCGCSKLKFQCHRSGHCVPKDFVCDGENDCPAGEDEEHCTGQKVIRNQEKNYLEVLQNSYGVWHTMCPSEVSKEHSDALCRDLGYKEALFTYMKNQTILAPKVDAFSWVKLNRKTNVALRNDRPFVRLVSLKKACAAVKCA